MEPEDIRIGDSAGGQQSSARSVIEGAPLSWDPPGSTVALSRHDIIAYTSSLTQSSCMRISRSATAIRWHPRTGTCDNFNFESLLAGAPPALLLPAHTWDQSNDVIVVTPITFPRLYNALRGLCTVERQLQSLPTSTSVLQLTLAHLVGHEGSAQEQGRWQALWDADGMYSDVLQRWGAELSHSAHANTRTLDPPSTSSDSVGASPRFPPPPPIPSADPGSFMSFFEYERNRGRNGGVDSSSSSSSSGASSATSGSSSSSSAAAAAVLRAARSGNFSELAAVAPIAEGLRDTIRAGMSVDPETGTPPRPRRCWTQPSSAWSGHKHSRTTISVTRVGHGHHSGRTATRGQSPLHC